MTNETRQRLLDALLSCRVIGTYTAGLDRAGYDRDGLVRDGVERRIGIIGEALSRAIALEPALAEQIPDVRLIEGMRNRIVHGYDAVSNAIVWDVVQNKLPALEVHLVEPLKENVPD